MKTWILLRGLGRDKRHFGRFLDKFQQAFADDTVITIDTLGNGEFKGLKSPTDIAKYTEHCRKILAQSGHNKAIELVALSLGGMVAMDWTTRYPQEINSITIMNTSAANLTPPHKRMQLSTLSRLLYAFLINCSNKGIESAIVNATSNQQILNPNALEQTIQSWTAIREQGVTSTINMIRQLAAAATFKLEKPPNIDPNKLLILASDKDHIVNHQASIDLQHFFNCPMLVHMQAGHDLPLDAPNWVIEQIKQHHTTEQINRQAS